MIIFVRAWCRKSVKNRFSKIDKKNVLKHSARRIDCSKPHVKIPFGCGVTVHSSCDQSASSAPWVVRILQKKLLWVFPSPYTNSPPNFSQIGEPSIFNLSNGELPLALKTLNFKSKPFYSLEYGFDSGSDFFLERPEVTW